MSRKSDRLDASRLGLLALLLACLTAVPFGRVEAAPVAEIQIGQALPDVVLQGLNGPSSRTP